MTERAPERTFAADMMMGKPVRWMRVLGFDVLCRNMVRTCLSLSQVH